MAGVVCKHCGSASHVKNGIVHGRQRYLCQGCSRTFTETPVRGEPGARKAMAILLYATGSMSFRSIGRMLNVSNVSVLRWVREYAARLPEPAAPTDGRLILCVDEMWHFIKKSQ